MTLISNVDQIHELLDYYVEVIGLGFNPDLNMEDYVNVDNEPSFGPVECLIHNAVLDEIRTKCNFWGLDIHETTMSTPAYCLFISKIMGEEDEETDN